MGQVVQYQRAEKLVMMKGGRKARWRLRDLNWVVSARHVRRTAAFQNRTRPTRRLRPTVTSSSQSAARLQSQ